MARNKPRLLLALYARPKNPNSSHYALFIMPKHAADKQRRGLSATKLHALNALQVVKGEAVQPWRFERTSTADLNDERRLLACVVVAKITDETAVARTLEAVPLYQDDNPDQAKAQSFDCVAWVREAIGRLKGSKAIASLPSFDTVQHEALGYLARKRHQSRWSEPYEYGVPIFDLVQGSEIIR